MLWPNEHKGEAVILHQAQGAATGSIILPQQPVRAITSSQMSEGLFDSDLSYQDAVENFFAWKKQALIGSETINGVSCQILESKPDSSSVSVYAKVRSWIDPQRFVPMRIEKYSSSGELVRRIDVTRVARDEKHHPDSSQSHRARPEKKQRHGIQWRAHRPGREFYRRRFHTGRTSQ